VHDIDADEHVVLEAEEMSSGTQLSSMSGMAKYWVGKDYTNFIVKDFTNLDAPYQGNIQSIDCAPGSSLPR
jgi:phospholipase D1/2